MSQTPNEAHVVARWLVGLRWVVFTVLAATLPVGERWFDFHVQWALALPALGLVFAFNVYAMRGLRTGAAASPRAVALGVAFDLVAIAVVLAASGGAANPFSALFFVHVALAASLLPPRTTFALSGLAACLFATLFFLPVGACCPNHPAHGAFSNHLYGMWMAFVLSAAIVAYVLTHARRALDDRQREIERLREREHQGARFAALGTLAAGTAHELATPLATIAVLSAEISEGRAPDAIAAAASIRAQVTRCREVITKMQVGAQAVSAASDAAPLGAVVEHAVEVWRAAHPEVSVRVSSDDALAVAPLPASELEAALCALLDNALHASPDRGTIDVTARGGDGPEVSVEDAGAGVAPHLAGRLGEPFLTTKEPGEGMGLGLFLVRTMIEQVGGRLEVAARVPRGTRVTLHLGAAVCR